MTEYENFPLGERVLDNLSSDFLKMAPLFELRICELSTLADESLSYIEAMLENELNLYEIMPLLSEELLMLFGQNTDKSEEISQKDKLQAENSAPAFKKSPLPENEGRLARFRFVTELTDRVELARLITERSFESALPITESQLLSGKVAPPSFTYLKNQYSDEAYDVFTDEMTGARVAKYSSGLREAARLVFDGEVGFCLLPLEEMGVRIASVSELIALYDLKINDVTPVLGFDGTADMKYAMLSRSYSVPSRDALDDRYLELRHAQGSAAPLSDIIFAASALGHKVYRLNTHRTLDEVDGRMYYSIVLRDDERDFSSLLTYLSLFSPDTTVVGIYKNLE